MRHLLERLELLSEASFSRDKEARDLARDFHSALVSYVKRNANRLKRTGDGGFVVEARRFWSGPGADSLFVLYVPKGAKGASIRGGLGTYRSKDVLVLPVLKAPWDVTGIDTRTDREIVVHEMIHFFDPGRGKGKAVNPESEKDYYNHPSEWNAFWQEGATAVEGMASNSMLINNKDYWRRVFGDDFKSFKNSMLKMGVWDKNFVKNLNSKNKKKFDKRLYQLWMEISRKDESETEGAIMKILREASYPGNIGFSEMMTFYKIATPDQVSEMEELLKRGDFKRAWKLLEKVAKTRMGNMNAKWNPKAVHL